MTAPDKIWATPYDEGDLHGTYASENSVYKTPPNGDAEPYHHQRGVDELLEALGLCLNYIENTESWMGEKMSSGDVARALIAKHRTNP